MPRMSRIVSTVAAALALASCSLVPETGSDPGQRGVRQSVRAGQPVYAQSAEARACHARLGATEARFSPLPDQYYGAGCSTLDTVQLTELRSDNASLALGNLGPVACPLAETFAAWARYGVDRAARQVLGSALVRIETMGSYSCRDIAGSAKRSAHATANAIDVSAFVLADGRRISVQQDWGEGSAGEREFLRIVHQSACKRFGTVLGPEYNAAHYNHFHLERSGTAFCR
jgi:hypothetical protein